MSHVSKLKKKEKKKKKEKDKDKKKKKQKQKEGNGEKTEKSRERNLFLRSTEIKSTVFVGARGKVHLRDEGYTWAPKLGSFYQTPRGREFPYFDYF